MWIKASHISMERGMSIALFRNKHVLIIWKLCSQILMRLMAIIEYLIMPKTRTFTGFGKLGLKYWQTEMKSCFSIWCFYVTIWQILLTDRKKSKSILEKLSSCRIGLSFVTVWIIISKHTCECKSHADNQISQAIKMHETMY